MDEQLESIAKIVNDHEEFWADLGDEEYLLRFGRTDDLGGGAWLVLMSDLGVTWEPYKAYPTPRYCTVPIDDAELAAKNLMVLANAYRNGELPDNANDDSFQHLVEEYTP